MSEDMTILELLAFGGGGSELTTLTATENGTYTPTSGYDGFNRVIVAIPTYDGTVEVTP